MKKSAQDKHKKKKHRQKEGLLSSPLVKGVWGLIPVVIGLVLGVSALSVGRGVKSEAVELINQKPKSPAGHLALARVAGMGGDIERAKAEYELAMELSGGEVLGVSSETKELINPEEAVREQLGRWEEEARETTSSKLYLRISAWYWRLNDEEKAKEAWRMAAEIDPNDQLVKNWGEIIGGN